MEADLGEAPAAGPAPALRQWRLGKADADALRPYERIVPAQAQAADTDANA